MMETVATAAILSVAFLIAIWVVQRKKWTGPAGPVIIITPPDPGLAGAKKVVGWKLGIGKSKDEPTWNPRLNGKMPARLLSDFSEVTFKMRNGAPEPMGFQSLRLQVIGSTDVYIRNDGADRLQWDGAGHGNWKSSAAPLQQWPQILSEPITDIVVTDSVGDKFGLADISEITIRMKDECACG